MMKFKVLTSDYKFLLIIIILLAGIFFPPLAFGEGDVEDESSVVEEPAGEYIGTMTCIGCHSEMKEGFLKTRHALSLGDPDAMPAEQGCEQCHGGGSLHLGMIGNETGDRGIHRFTGDKADEQFKASCFECHDARVNYDIWMEGYHQEAELNCASCHDTHNRKFDYQLKMETSLDLCYSCHTSIKGQFEAGRSHHPLRDDKGCVICHNPHGEVDDLLYTDTLEYVCGTCHVDTAGPYVFQHLTGTSDTGEGCFNCHMPHSSGNLNLLKANGRAVCVSCHTDMGDHKGAATCWTSGCHSQIHGSNNNMLFIR
jgi:DmsE family decaheme c-type cytochrome